MRFEISKVLDAIEGRVCTDPALARAVVDLAEVIRWQNLDGGRPASLLRLGMVIDALSRQLGEDSVPVYAIVHRALLSDADLTSNERMVVRRWADDGLVEVLDHPGDRMLEVADLLGLPVLSRVRFNGLGGRFPWLGQAGRVLAPVPGAGGPVFIAHVGGGQDPASGSRSPVGAKLLARQWRCPEPGCALFGDGGGGGAFADLARVDRAPAGQPPPTLRNGVPTCPRHGVRLGDAGPRPRTEVLAVRIGGLVRRRFVLTETQPVLVGRAPDSAGGIVLGQWLNDEARRWISRSHVRFELRAGRGEVIVTDTSTNGSGVRPGGSMAEPDRIALAPQQSRVLGEGDIIELYPGVQVGRADELPSDAKFTPTSVMAEAPTMAMRLPRP
ncbi:FHA domain-containing protein [Micromonospora sp. DR5-3]|uniref:FHA domain-containing protein n=1 Tax=unclassified Micromonospora TaxID=2617518 RepID=UPI0011D9373B|nr:MULTISPECIES: FHA domain-containing protein [unclassified Micromonospora]MCW3814819.1 FHA domain-containing protein [Micromonospora sp. DR5-3]TYC24142.1 FHA domain-containing protein [Micromonospora sp. MP36]